MAFRFHRHNCPHHQRNLLLRETDSINKQALNRICYLIRVLSRFIILPFFLVVFLLIHEYQQHSKTYTATNVQLQEFTNTRSFTEGYFLHRVARNGLQWDSPRVPWCTGEEGLES